MGRFTVNSRLDDVLIYSQVLESRLIGVYRVGIDAC